MARFLIEGGRQLSGSVHVSGNKNEALPAIAACLLTDQPVILENMPNIGDVNTLVNVLESLGVTAKWHDDTTLELHAKNILHSTPDRELCSKVRASILLIGPLLARTGQANVALPGGDIIGARRIDTHWEGFESLGARLELSDAIVAHADKLVGSDIFFDEPSVTATENIVMASTLAQGTTRIYNAASEPHVVGLCEMLVGMGAQISGVGSNLLEICGVKSLHGSRHRIGSDFMEAGSFICLGGMSGSDLEVKNVQTHDMRFILKTFKKLGIETTAKEKSIFVHGKESRLIQKEVSGRIGTIYSGPWPAFPTDLMSVAIVAATQSQGTMIFFEKMFEARMFFTDKLLQMGAHIVLCDPHRIVLNGPSKLFAARMSSPDVRAGMALVMAAICAEGTSVIDNIYQIERGYMNIEKKLQSLGANITKEE